MLGLLAEDEELETTVEVVDGVVDPATTVVVAVELGTVEEVVPATTVEVFDAMFWDEAEEVVVVGEELEVETTVEVDGETVEVVEVEAGTVVEVVPATTVLVEVPKV